MQKWKSLAVKSQLDNAVDIQIKKLDVSFKLF